MERKVGLLEQRLNLVEQFVETRFCESYRDFLLRSWSTTNSTDVTVTKTKRNQNGPDDSSKLLATFMEQRFCESFREFTVRHLSSQSYSSGGGSTSISSQPSTSTPRKSRHTTTPSSTATPTKRELRIKVIRLEDTKVFPSPSSSTTPSKNRKISDENDKHGNSTPQVWSPVPPPSPLSGLNDDNFEETSKKDDGGDDSYFTFPFEENEVDGGDKEEDDSDPLGTPAIEPGDQNWSETTSSTDSDSELGKKSSTSSSKCNKKTKKLIDLKRNGEERNFKCGYPPCDKAFFEKKHLAEHERVHQKDKWLECRVEECGSSWKDNSKRLRHERLCIVKRLREDKYVDPKVIEDVRRRSLKLKEDPFKEFKMLPNLEVDEEGRPLKKKKKKEPSYAYKPEMEGDIVNGEKRICPICKEHWNVDLFDGHVKSHVMERTLKCGICGKGFFNRKMRYKHEKEHDKDKYGLKCRVGGAGNGGGGDGDEQKGEVWCKASFTDKYKLTVHERGCVRRALEKGREVAEEVIEDVRRRSVGVMLSWRGYDVEEEVMEGGKKVKVCFVCKKWRGVQGGREYEEHMEGHRKWGCGKCEGRFLTKKDLVRHVYRKHREKGKKRELGGEEEMRVGDVEMEKVREEEEGTGEPDKNSDGVNTEI